MLAVLLKDMNWKYYKILFLLVELRGFFSLLCLVQRLMRGVTPPLPIRLHGAVLA